MPFPDKKKITRALTATPRQCTLDADNFKSPIVHREVNMPTSANGLALAPLTPSPLTPEPSVRPEESPEVRPASPQPITRPRTVAPFKKLTHLSRLQILDATETCLVAEGYDGTTIRRIARQLGCAVGSIYRYFTDKRQLLAAVTHRRFEPVETAFEAGLAIEQVQQMYARIADEHPEQYRLMFWLASVGQSQAGRHLPQIIERLIDLWADRLGDRREAELQWVALHGNLMLGGLNRPSLSTIAPAPRPQPITTTEDLTLL
jgi:AcrR family transcriptional regulator